MDTTTSSPSTVITHNKSVRLRNESYFNAWSWQYTELHSDTNTSLAKQDIMQLLLNRGESECFLTMICPHKSDLISFLKRKYFSYLAEDKLKQLSTEQISAELKLHGLSTRTSRNMHQRLKNGLMEKLPKFVSLNRRLPSKFGTPFMLNKNEYCIATKDDGLHKYNAKQNFWIKWIDFPKKLLSGDCKCISICMNQKENTIYLMAKSQIINTTKAKLFKINCKTKHIDEIRINLPPNAWLIKTLFVNGELHLFCNSGYIERMGHWRFTENTKTFKEIYTFGYVISKYDILFQSQGNHEQLILIAYVSLLRKLYMYSYCNKNWNRIELKFPEHMDTLIEGVVMTRNCKYIILYSKVMHRAQYRLLVIDTENEEIIESNITIPSQRAISVKWKAMITNNEMDEEYTVYGYVRKCWRECDIGMDKFPPQYLVKLIQIRYSSEENDDFHLLEETGASHWKMKVGYIINNLNEYSKISKPN